MRLLLQTNDVVLISYVSHLLSEEGIDFEVYVRGIEHELIRRALEKTGGNKGQASRLLNLKRTTLVEKLKRLEPRADS